MTISTFAGPWLRSPTLRLIGLGALTVGFAVPLLVIDVIVGERRARRDTAVADVSAQWGLHQLIVGPALVVPYVVRTIDPAPAAGKPVEHVETLRATFLPSRLQINGTMKTETRSRGIFTIPVYHLSATLEGEFAPLDWASLGIDPRNARLDAAVFVVGISDVRAISDRVAVTWNGSAVNFLPGIDHLAGATSGIHAPVDPSRPGRFSFPLELNGSVGVSFVPFAELTSVSLTSNSPNPSFSGNWLPTTRSASADGFRAAWTVPYLGRNYAQQWTSATEPEKPIIASAFGVDLVQPVDQYRMSERSLKYGALFVLLTFLTVWLIEVLTGVIVHPVQYLLVGVALCVFFLLELSASEHLGFPIAYALSASAVVAVVAAYSVAVLGRRRRAIVVGFGTATLYGYLYVLLTNEDYALLIGSIGLLVVVAGIMFLTRRVDWYRLGRDEQTATSLPQSARL